MFVPTKLLFVILLIFAVWYALRWFNRTAPKAVRRGPSPWTRSGPGQRQQTKVEDLVSCRACGAYVAASARRCGKAGCPWPA